jgi:hypothetical protein
MDQTPEAKPPPPHITAYLGHVNDQIKFMKQQQWAITNYGVLILAAIYAIKLPQLGHAQSICKGLLAIVTAAVGSWLLLRIQCDMTRVRGRLETILKTYFTTDELRGIGFKEEEIIDLRAGKRYPWWRGMEFTWPLMAVLVMGAVLVCLAL